jgi:aminoglycoside phosphotransferase family enzyme
MLQLPETVQALLNPEAYPDTPGQIELVQTQMSFVFLTDKHVYKVKKPVNLGYLDYATLERRRFYCQREVELNQRLCPDIYLGVLPVVRMRGEISIGGEGEIIEYAVKMSRLPQGAMMDVLLARNEMSSGMVGSVAAKLAEFHCHAETSDDICRFGDLETVIQNTEENFAQTEKYIGWTVTQGEYQCIKEYTERFIRHNAPLFHRRILDRRIRDCHGDLHAAHICFLDDICIYDCIEFNDRFRYSDIASEVAFLAMDLDHYGRADLSRDFVNAYVDSSQDRGLMALLDFYKCYRAYVRGKVESFKLDDPHIAEKEKKKVLSVAKKYFRLAESYVL